MRQKVDDIVRKEPIQIVALVDALLECGIIGNASDIHIDPYERTIMRL